MAPRLTRAEREKLTDEVLEELRDGNWPTCQSCGRADRLTYIGLVADVPTFFCRRCSLAMGLNLVDA